VIPHSPLYEEASRFSYSMTTVVDIYVGGEPEPRYQDVPVTDGKVSCDRDAKVRWNASVELALYPWQDVSLIDSYQTRFKVYRGITSLGRTEMLQLGEYRVDDLGRSEIGRLTLAGSGLEAYVVDARFLSPRVPPTGISTVKAIEDLIVEAVPGVTRIYPMNTADRRVQATAPWDRDRIDAVLALADSLNTDVFADYDGRFVLADKPTAVERVPMFAVNEGDGGVLIGRDVSNTRDGVYNAVSVTGESTDKDGPPVWNWARDNDPASPTYFYGAFGQKPRFYSSQYIYDNTQAGAVAGSMLAEALAVNSTLSFESLAMCFLTAGDVVAVQLEDRSFENHLLQKTELGLTSSGTLSCETFVNRTGAGGDA
jgi:Domain of unknown function (DUF5047)